MLAEDLFPDLDLEPWPQLGPEAAVAMHLHGFAIGANGDLEGFPTTRRPADYTGMSILRVDADDQIRATWEEWASPGS